MKLFRERFLGLADLLAAGDLAKILRTVLYFLFSFLSLGALAYVVHPAPSSLSVTQNSAVMAVVALASIFLLRRGNPNGAVGLMLAGCGGVLTWAAWQGAGLFGPAYICLGLLVLGTGMHWGQRAGLLAAAVASAAGLGLLLAGRAGWLVNAGRPVADWLMWATLTAIFILLAVMNGLMLRYLDEMLNRARSEVEHRTRAENEVRRLNDDLERRIAERTAELAESERLLNIISASVQDVIWIADLQFNTSFTSRPMVPRGAPGDGASQVLKGLTPESLARARQALQTELEIEARGGADPNRSHILPLDYYRPDGSTLRMEARASFLRDDQGRAVGLVGINRDIEERTRMENALRESEERYRRITSVISDYSYSVKIDAQGNYTPEWVAGAFEEMTGYTFADYLASGGWMNLIHPDSLTQDGFDREDLLANRPVEGSVLCIRRKDGGLRWVRNFAYPVWHITENRLAGVYGGVQDITAEREARQRLESLNAELEKRVAERTTRLEQALGELESFSYSISHDLRAPLRAVNGYAGMLLAEHADLPPDVAERLHQIQLNGQRMGQLVDGLLQFLNSGSEPIARQQVNPGEIVQSVLDRLSGQYAGRKVAVSVGDLPPCRANLRLLDKVYESLVSNAIKFSRDRDPARIEIGALTQGEGVVYYVRDNGVGFDMKYYDKLFGVFQRLHHLDEFDGIGASLAIVNRIIQRHGGRIWAEAEPDKGATFYFTVG